jgi:hypothetical protein
MVNITLVEEPVNIDKFTEFGEKLPTLFLGFAIKNEYDHQRLEIKKKKVNLDYYLYTGYFYL